MAGIIVGLCSTFWYKRLSRVLTGSTCRNFETARGGSDLFYSYLNASIGSSEAALCAG